MSWWFVPGQGTVWIEDGQGTGEGATELPVYWNSWQFSPSEGGGAGPHWQWSVDLPGAGNAPAGYDQAPGYLGTLLDYAAKAEMGTLSDLERWQWEDMRSQAMAIPTRDVSRLYGGWTGSQEDPNAQWLLAPGSPDLGAVMLNIRDKMMHGTASGHEQALYQQLESMARDWNYRASVPQASDVPFGLGDNLFGALATIGIGTGLAGFAAAPLTLGGIASGAGAFGGITGMLGEALDEQALRQVAMALGLVGGGAGLASLASQGVSSLGDMLKLAQKTYSLGSKAAGVASNWGGRDDPAQAGLQNPDERLYSMDPSYRPGQPGVGSRTQASTAGGTGGGSMDLSQLGPVLAGLVGAVGTGLSLADIARYMGQLKDQYGDQQGIKDLIDSAYQLAASRYEQYYASTLQQQKQAQEAYQDALTKYQKHYEDTQLEQSQRQEAYGEQRQQIAEDRNRAIQRYQEGIQKYDDSYNKRVQQAQEDRDRRINVFGEDRAIAQANFQERVAQARQDRDREVAVFNQDYAKYQQNFDQRMREAAEERGLDVNAYQSRQAIGAGLRDPAQIAAGAEGIYKPLSDLAREMTSRDVQAEMGTRGISGQGQYANIMSARAFAPLEQQMWQNALAAWLQSQNTAIGAYGNMDLAGSPEYQFARVPDFATSPEFQYTQVPNMGGIPQYEMQNVPAFPRQSGANVPGAVELPGRPQVPTAVRPGVAPGISGYTANPYKPFGTDASTGGGKDGVLGGVDALVRNLTQMGLPGGALYKLISSLIGGGTQVPGSFLSYDQGYGPGSSGDPAFAASDDPYAHLYESAGMAGGYGPWESGYNFPEQSMYGPYEPEYLFPPDASWSNLDLSSW